MPCISASKSSVLQQQKESFKTASEIITNLKEMFGDQGKPDRLAAMKTIMSTKMAEGTAVQEHVMKMMDSLNELKVLGVEIDAESQVDIMFESSARLI